MESRPDILSVPEAASLMGCSDVWVIRMIRSGALEGFKLSGRAWAVSRKSIEKSIAEYEKRDPSRAGRKRKGRHVEPRVPKAKPLHTSDATQASRQNVVYISGQEAARRLGVAPITVSRVARRHGIGIIVEDGRLAALATTDLPLLKPYIHETSGNPNWIAAKGAGKRSRLKTRRKPKAE
jgi:excisionase family DNA binding protein